MSQHRTDAPDGRTELRPSGASSWAEELVDGPWKPEDVLHLPGTRYLLLSSMHERDAVPDAPRGGVYTVDLDDHSRISKIWPRAGSGGKAGSSPGRAGAAELPSESVSPHGIGLRTNPAGSHTLYVVNHGARESIEILRICVGDTGPTATWTGSVELPAGTWGNAVAADPMDDGFYVTHYLNPTDFMGSFRRMFDRESSGYVLHWTPEGQWTKVAGTDLPGPNGLLVGPGGDYLVVASWGGREIRQYPLGGGRAPVVTPIPVRPDNLRWAPDGTVTVTGQELADFDEFIQSTQHGNCPTFGYRIFRFTPGGGLDEIAFGAPGDFKDPSTALEVDGDIVVGTVGGGQLVRLRHR